MATTTAFAVLLAVVVLLRALQRYAARRRFREMFRYTPINTNIRRVDRDLCTTAFALSTWLEVQEELHERIGHVDRTCAPSHAELLQAAEKIAYYQHDFWHKFRVAEDCGMPLRYVIMNQVFGVTIVFGRRAEIRADLTANDSFREDVDVYAHIHLPTAFAFDRKMAALMTIAS